MKHCFNILKSLFGKKPKSNLKENIDSYIVDIYANQLPNCVTCYTIIVRNDNGIFTEGKYQLFDTNVNFLINMIMNDLENLNIKYSSINMKNINEKVVNNLVIEENYF